MDLRELHPARYIKSVYEEEMLEKALKELEMEGKIEKVKVERSLSGLPLPDDPWYDDKSEIEAPVERWYRDKETGEVWAFIPPDFPGYGEWVKVEEKEKELKEYFEARKEQVERTRKVEFSSIEDFYDFLLDLVSFFQKIEEDLAFQGLKIDFNGSEEGIQSSKQEVISLQVDGKDKFVKVIRERARKRSFSLGDIVGEMTLTKGEREVKFDFYLDRGDSSSDETKLGIYFFITLNDSNEFVIEPFEVSFSNFKEIVKENKGKIFQEEYEVKPNYYHIFSRGWKLIDGWEQEEGWSDDYTENVGELTKALIKGLSYFEPKDLLYEAVLNFYSYESMFGFLTGLCRLLKEMGVEGEIPILYKWNTEEYTETKKVNMESVEKFIESILIPIEGKHYDERLHIVGALEFDYYHNLGYQELIEFNPTKGKYEHNIVFTGFPTEVDFETYIQVNQNREVLLGGFRLPEETFLNLVEKNGGKWKTRIIYDSF